MKRYVEFAKIAQEQIEEALQQEAILDACAKVMTETVLHDGVIHVFGCGHSQMFAEELCFRTGGLVPVNAIIIPLLIPKSAVFTADGALRRLCAGSAGYHDDICGRYDDRRVGIRTQCSRHRYGAGGPRKRDEGHCGHFPELFHASDFTAFQRQAAQRCQ